jgi:hypothetical protein
MQEHDPRDVTDDLGLQDARDEDEREHELSEDCWCEPEVNDYTGEPIPPWVSRHDTYDEFKGER